MRRLKFIIILHTHTTNLACSEFSIIYNFMDPPWHTLIPQSHFKDKNIDKCSDPFPGSMFWCNKKHSSSRMQDVCSSGTQTAPPVLYKKLNLTPHVVKKILLFSFSSWHCLTTTVQSLLFMSQLCNFVFLLNFINYK